MEMDQILDESFSKGSFEVLNIPTVWSCGGRKVNLDPALDEVNHERQKPMNGIEAFTSPSAKDTSPGL